MRKPSILVPLGGVVATWGIYLPLMRLGLRVPESRLPVSLDLGSLPEVDLNASSAQRLFLVGMLALALAAWVLPLLVPRTTAVGVGLASGAGAIATVAAYRAWAVEIRGPRAVLDGDTPFLERAALGVLDRLHSSGVLKIHPAEGLWALTVGAVMLVVGLGLSLLPARQAEVSGATRARPSSVR